MMNIPMSDAADETGLVLELTLPDQPILIGEETPAKVRIVNCGIQEIRVNGRLAMAYPDTDDRELYCHIMDETGEAYTEYRRFQLDYRRKPLEKNHFITLKPGKSLEKTFDLQEWYRLTRPGIYQVQLIYHPEAHNLLSSRERYPIHSAPVFVRVTE